MTNSNTLLVDCDGVMLNWWASCNQWLIDNDFSTTNDLTPDSDYALEGVVKPELVSIRDNLIKIFNETHHVSKLKPVFGAIRALERFHQYGWTIKAITSFSSNFESMKLRETNLINTFGPIFQEIHCIPLYQSKKEYLSKQPKDSVYVEDVVNHLNTAEEVGLDRENLFLIPRFHNEKDTGGFSRMTWPAISAYVLGE